MKTEDKKDQIKEIPSIQPDKANIEEASIQQELKTSKPVGSAIPKESERQYSKKVGDYKKVVEAAGAKGVDLNKIDQMPLMDSDKDKITEAVKGMYPKEFAQGINSLSNSITAPKNEAINKLDQKVLMDLEKKKRRAKFADALYAFGEGIQGRTADQNNFVSTKIQRKQDEQFQNFKDVTERNQKTKYLWETQSRKELVDWVEEQAKNERLDAREREKFQMMADQFKVETGQKNRGLDLEADRNKIARERIWADKNDKNEKIETKKAVYNLTPERASFIRGEMLKGKNSEILKKKYPNFYEEVDEYKSGLNEFGEPAKVPTGRKITKLRTDLSNDEIKRAYLEIAEDQADEQDLNERRNFTSNLGKIQGASQVAKLQSAKPKADPLGLGL